MKNELEIKNFLKEVSEAHQFNDLNNCLSTYIDFIDVLIFLNEILAEKGNKVKDWEKYFETLTLKFAFHGISLHKILSGVKFSSKFYKNIQGKSINILDNSSAKSILRAQFETFLMMRHIYVNPSDEDSKELRYCAWIYTALLKRQDIPANDINSKSQKEKDLISIEDFQKRIKSLNSFKKLSQKQQESLLKMGNGKLFNHWARIIEETGFPKDSAFNALYEYLSIYSHSEGLSVIQLNTIKFMPNNEHSIYQACMDLYFSKILTCVFIKDIVNKFPTLNETFQNLPDKVKLQVEINLRLAGI
jgi:hypothetical protein